jgi:hypothetical protein
MNHRFLRSAVVVLVAAASCLISAPSARASDSADFVEVYERDVFVIVGSTLRHPDASTPHTKPLFNVAGVNLGITWGKWKSAAPVTTSVMAQGPTNTTARFTFKRLKPGGVYSLFYGTISPDSENPKCPAVERTLPVTSFDSAQVPDFASFIAKADGTAAFRGRIPGHPLNKAQQVYVQLVWHSNGETYGDLPNKGEFTTTPTCRSSFGEDAMRQLTILQKW